MKRCPKCEYPNPDKLSTCFNCQAALEEPKPQDVPDSAPTPKPDSDQAMDAGSNLCANCGGQPEEGDYILPLCKNCRDTFANRPLPSWITSSFVAIVFILLYVFFKFPGTLAAGIAFERGQRAEAVNDYALAQVQYRAVVKKFPDAYPALARLGTAQCRMGDLQAATATLEKIPEGKSHDELMREIEYAIRAASSPKTTIYHRRR